MFIETHTHLTDEQFDSDRDQVLARARQAGVELFIEIGEDEPQWPKARALAEAHPDVYWTAGFHPSYAVKADAELVHRMEAALRHPRCVAVGEIGLDYYRDHSPRDVQHRVLDDLVKVAVRAKTPMVLHCRESGPGKIEAQRDMLAILNSVPAPAPGDRPVGVAHCFQGTEETAHALIARGFMIGVDAPLTYPTSSTLRALLSQIPLQSLVLETDSPYLPPQSRRGKRNEPTHIPAIAKALADLKQVPIETIAAMTSDNARRLFQLIFLSRTTAGHSRAAER
jgi:TatD DNase family protein